MTNYESGADKERDVTDLFQDDNDDMNRDACAVEAIRSAGSKGIFDVVILNPNGVRFIQVKKIEQGGSWKSEHETQAEIISNLPKPSNVSYEYWVWENYNGWIHREVIQ